jgi:hypothetical protein
MMCKIVYINAYKEKTYVIFLYVVLVLRRVLK